MNSENETRRIERLLYYAFTKSMFGCKSCFLVVGPLHHQILECGAIVIYGKKLDGTSVLRDMDPCSNFTEERTRVRSFVLSTSETGPVFPVFSVCFFLESQNSLVQDKPMG